MTFFVANKKGVIKITRSFKNLFVDDNNSDFFLFNSNTSYYSVCGDRGLYNKFKDGLLDTVNENQAIKIKILSLLEAYGFPMDELGTYFYKDIILRCYEVINSEQDKDYFNRCNMLLEDLKDPYSNFYFDIARNDNDIGTTTFHLYIEKAFNLINTDTVNPNLPNNIFTQESETTNYGLQAYQLASFISKPYSIDSFDEVESKNPMTLKLLSKRNSDN